MKFYGVTSSMLVALGYNPDRQELVAQFDAETYYLYKEVSPTIVVQVLFADSVGQTFNKLVKKGKGISYEKLTPSQAAAL